MRQSSARLFSRDSGIAILPFHIQPFRENDFDLSLDEILISGHKLGQGSFGVVYSACHGDELVAAKFQKLPDSIVAQKTLLAELSILKSIVHPNLVKFIGAAKVVPPFSERMPFDGAGVLVIMERCLLGDLHSVALKYKNDKNFSWKLRVKLAKQMAAGLACLHSHQIIHRDIKARNVLLDVDWNAKLCDYGLAIYSEAHERLQNVGGTEEYMAPEIQLGEDYSLSADVFSLGIVFCAVISGRTPGEGGYIVRTARNLFAVDEEEIRTSFPSDCPASLATLCIMCCKLNPEERPTAQEIVDWLEDLFAELPGECLCPDTASLRLFSTPAGKLAVSAARRMKERARRKSFGSDDFHHDYRIVRDFKRNLHEVAKRKSPSARDAKVVTTASKRAATKSNPNQKKKKLSAQKHKNGSRSSKESDVSRESTDSKDSASTVNGKRDRGADSFESRNNLTEQVVEALNGDDENRDTDEEDNDECSALKTDVVPHIDFKPEMHSSRSYLSALSAIDTPRSNSSKKFNDFDSVGRVAALERRHSTGDIRFHIDFDDLPISKKPSLPRQSMPAPVYIVKSFTGIEEDPTELANARAVSLQLSLPRTEVVGRHRNANLSVPAGDPIFQKFSLDKVRHLPERPKPSFAEFSDTESISPGIILGGDGLTPMSDISPMRAIARGSRVRFGGDDFEPSHSYTGTEYTPCVDVVNSVQLEESRGRFDYSEVVGKDLSSKPNDIEKPQKNYGSTTNEGQPSQITDEAVISAVLIHHDGTLTLEKDSDVTLAASTHDTSLKDDPSVRLGTEIQHNEVQQHLGMALEVRGKNMKTSDLEEEIRAALGVITEIESATNSENTSTAADGTLTTSAPLIGFETQSDFPSNLASGMNQNASHHPVGSMDARSHSRVESEISSRAYDAESELSPARFSTNALRRDTLSDDDSDTDQVLEELRKASKDEILQHVMRLLKQAKRLFKVATSLLNTTKQLLQEENQTPSAAPAIPQSILNTTTDLATPQEPKGGRVLETAKKFEDHAKKYAAAKHQTPSPTNAAPSSPTNMKHNRTRGNRREEMNSEPVDAVASGSNSMSALVGEEEVLSNIDHSEAHSSSRRPTIESNVMEATDAHRPHGRRGRSPPSRNRSKTHTPSVTPSLVPVPDSVNSSDISNLAHTTGDHNSSDMVGVDLGSLGRNAYRSEPVTSPASVNSQDSAATETHHRKTRPVPQPHKQRAESARRKTNVDSGASMDSISNPSMPNASSSVVTKPLRRNTERAPNRFQLPSHATTLTFPGPNLNPASISNTGLDQSPVSATSNASSQLGSNNPTPGRSRSRSRNRRNKTTDPVSSAHPNSNPNATLIRVERHGRIASRDPSEERRPTSHRELNSHALRTPPSESDADKSNRGTSANHEKESLPTANHSAPHTLPRDRIRMSLAQTLTLNAEHGHLTTSSSFNERTLGIQLSDPKKGSTDAITGESAPSPEAARTPRRTKLHRATNNQSQPTSEQISSTSPLMIRKYQTLNPKGLGAGSRGRAASDYQGLISPDHVQLQLSKVPRRTSDPTNNPI